MTPVEEVFHWAATNPRRIPIYRILTLASALAAAVITTPSVAQVGGDAGYTPAVTDTGGTVWLVRSQDALAIKNSRQGSGRFWVRHDHSMDPAAGAALSVSYFEANCWDRSFELIQSVSYTLDGDAIPSVYETSHGRKYAIDGTVIGTTLDFVCK